MRTIESLDNRLERLQRRRQRESYLRSVESPGGKLERLQQRKQREGKLAADETYQSASRENYMYYWTSTGFITLSDTQELGHPWAQPEELQHKASTLYKQTLYQDLLELQNCNAVSDHKLCHVNQARPVRSILSRIN